MHLWIRQGKITMAEQNRLYTICLLIAWISVSSKYIKLLYSLDKLYEKTEMPIVISYVSRVSVCLGEKVCG